MNQSVASLQNTSDIFITNKTLTYKNLKHYKSAVNGHVVFRADLGGMLISFCYVDKDAEREIDDLEMNLRVAMHGKFNKKESKGRLVLAKSAFNVGKRTVYNLSQEGLLFTTKIGTAAFVLTYFDENLNAIVSKAEEEYLERVKPVRPKMTLATTNSRLLTLVNGIGEIPTPDEWAQLKGILYGYR